LTTRVLEQNYSYVKFATKEAVPYSESPEFNSQLGRRLCRDISMVLTLYQSRCCGTSLKRATAVFFSTSLPVIYSQSLLHSWL